MVDIRLSANFRLSEFVKSSTATEMKIDNTPDDTIIVNLFCLAQNVLQPVRDWFGKPISISSGYRCKKLNSAVGGAKNSQHMTGEAADLWIKDVRDRRAIFEYIREFTSFDQLIMEHDKKGSYWIHVSCKRDASKNRRQVIDDLLKS